jgi:acyl-CoA synthetase (AMP-forming)/AMP-acid ligase II
VATETDARNFVDELLRAVSATPDAPAVIAGDVHLTFGDLERRVDAAAAALRLPSRSLVVLVGDRTIDFVVAYLAVQRAGHVPLLAAAQHARAAAVTWAAGALVHADDRGLRVERLDAPAPVLHPDLALLLSTSGSTGSPKLVRLSHENLSRNAAAIAEFLRLTSADRGISSLPLHYCYGLSILHSHLSVGASVVLTEASVVDPSFRHSLDRHSVTNLAGVPHTFDLLERSGFHFGAHRGLRFVTQAGGSALGARRDGC